MSSAVLGMVGTGDFTAEMRPTNFGSAILKVQPGAPTVLTMMTGMLPSRNTDDPKFTFFEGDCTVESALTTGTHTDVVTQINLDTSTDTYPARRFHVGGIVQNTTTREQMEVVGLDTTAYAYITVKRGVANGVYGVSGVAMAAGEVIHAISTGAPEGDNSPDPIQDMPSTVWNQTQIVRTSMELTGTAMHTYLRTGKYKAEAKWQCTCQHALKLERMYLMGQRLINADGVRYAGGLDYFVTTHVEDFSVTPFTEDNFLNFLQGPMTFTGTSANKVALCGATAYAAVTAWARKTNNPLQMEPKSKTYGLHIENVITSHGNLALMLHPMLTRETQWASDMYVIDMQNIKRVHHDGRKTMFDRGPSGRGIQANDKDSVKFEYKGEESIQISHEGSHGIAHGITEFVV